VERAGRSFLVERQMASWALLGQIFPWATSPGESTGIPPGSAETKRALTRQLRNDVRPGDSYVSAQLAVFFACGGLK
jgi:hypothetical protein